MLLMPSSLWQVASNMTLIVLPREEALEQEAGFKSLTLMLIRVKLVNKMAAVALTPCFARPSAAMILSV